MARRFAVPGLALVCCNLWMPCGQAQENLRNPFGFADVRNPDGQDVAEFADAVYLARDENDDNAALWTQQASRGLPGFPDGKWASRWKGGNEEQWVTGESTIVTIDDRVYVYYKDRTSSYLMETRRDGSRLAGRYVNTRDPTDTGPWVGEIVNEERIDGVWRSGRWDLRRRLISSTVASAVPRAAAPPSDGRGLTFAQQIGFARELLRNGALSDAANMVRDSLARNPAPSTGDARDLALARALVFYSDENWRGVYDEACAIHRAKQAGQVNIDAALMKSLVYLRKGVLPLAAEWRKYAAQHVPESILVAGLDELIAAQGGAGATYTLSRTVPFATHEGYQIDVWHGGDDVLQGAVLSVRKGDNFRGAFALERFVGGDSEAYELRFYDLDADARDVTFFGNTKPSEEELVGFVGQFNPEPGADGYSILRAELEALYWQREGVAPYAAQWAKRAAGSPTVSEAVEKPLRAVQLWSWELRQREPYQADAETTFEIHEFVNAELPDLNGWNDPERRSTIDAAIRDKGPLEHVHIIIVSPGSQKYLGSVILESSEPLPGERIFYLSSLLNGERRRLRHYDAPLSPVRLTEEMKQALAEVRAPVANGENQ